ncbi:MAG: eL32 family ribosomal protein [Nanoarchaeota archaeon]
MTKLKPIFRQVSAHNYSKLGLRRKKKLKYRRPGGGDNKIRLNRAGRLRKVKIGFKNQSSTRNLLNGKNVVMVYNLKDLKKIGKDNIGIIAKIGNKNKKIIAEEVIKQKINIYKFNPENFLRNLEEKMKLSKKSKERRIVEKMNRDKKSKEKEEKNKLEEKDKDHTKLEKKVENKNANEEVLNEDEKKIKEAKIEEK